MHINHNAPTPIVDGRPLNGHISRAFRALAYYHRIANCKRNWAFSLVEDDTKLANQYSYEQCTSTHLQ